MISYFIGKPLVNKYLKERVESWNAVVSIYLSYSSLSQKLTMEINKGFFVLYCIVKKAWCLNYLFFNLPVLIENCLCRLMAKENTCSIMFYSWGLLHFYQIGLLILFPLSSTYLFPSSLLQLFSVWLHYLSLQYKWVLNVIVWHSYKIGRNRNCIWWVVNMIKK